MNRLLALLITTVCVSSLAAQPWANWSNGPLPLGPDTNLRVAMDDAGNEETSPLKTPHAKEIEAISTTESITRLPPSHAITSSNSGTANCGDCRSILINLIQRAQTTSPSVAAAQARVESAAGSAWQASLLPNPTIGYAGQEIGNEDAAGQHGIFVGKTQVRGNKIGFRHDVASKDIQTQQIAVQSEMARVAIAVRRAFFRTLVAGRRAEILRELVASAQQTSDSVSQLVDAQEMAKPALFQAQLAVTTFRTQLIAAEKQHEASRRALAVLVNLPEATLPPYSCSGHETLPNYQWDVLVRQASASLKTQQQKTLVEKAMHQVDLEQARQIPNVDWQFAVYYDDASSDPFYSLQVSRPLQLYDRNQGNIQSAHAELHATQSDQVSIIQQIRVRLAEAYREFDSQRSRVALIESELLPKSRESMQLTRLALEAGEIGYLEALVSQQTYAQANQQYFDALDAAWQAAAQLEAQLLQ